jgi:hypothetical protein
VCRAGLADVDHRLRGRIEDAATLVRLPALELFYAGPVA